MIGNKYNPGQLEAARSLLVQKLMTADAAKRRNPDEPEVDWEFLKFAGLRKEDVYPPMKAPAVMESEADKIGMSMKALGEEIGGIEITPADAAGTLVKREEDFQEPMMLSEDWAEAVEILLGLDEVKVDKRALPEEEQNPTPQGIKESEVTETHETHEIHETHDPDHPHAAHIHLEETNNPKPHGDSIPLDFHPRQVHEITHGENEQGKPYGPHTKRDLTPSNCKEDPPKNIGNSSPMVTGGLFKRDSDRIAYDTYRPNSNYYAQPAQPAQVSAAYYPNRPAHPARPANPYSSPYFPYPSAYASSPFTQGRSKQVKVEAPQELTTISDGCNTVHLDPERLNVLVLLCEDICRYAIYAELSPDENSALLPACAKCKRCGFVDNGDYRYPILISDSGSRLTPISSMNEVGSGVRQIDPSLVPVVIDARKEVASPIKKPEAPVPTYTLSTDPAKGGSISDFFQPDGTLDTQPFMKAIEASMDRDHTSNKASAASWGATKQDDDRQVVDFYELILDRKEPKAVYPPLSEEERRKYDNERKARFDREKLRQGDVHPYHRPSINPDYPQMQRQKNPSSTPTPAAIEAPLPKLVKKQQELPTGSGVSKLTAASPIPDPAQVINRGKKDGKVHTHRNNVIPGASKSIPQFSSEHFTDLALSPMPTSAPSNLAAPLNKEKIFGLGKQEIKPNRDALIGKTGKERETKGGQDIKRNQKPGDIVIKMTGFHVGYEEGGGAATLITEGEEKEVEIEMKEIEAVDGAAEREEGEEEWVVVDVAEAERTEKRQGIKKPEGKKEENEGKKEKKGGKKGQVIHRGEESPSGIAKLGVKEFVGEKEKGSGCCCGPSCGCGAKKELKGDECASGCGCGSGPPEKED